MKKIVICFIVLILFISGCSIAENSSDENLSTSESYASSLSVSNSQETSESDNSFISEENESLESFYDESYISEAETSKPAESNVSTINSDPTENSKPSEVSSENSRPTENSDPNAAQTLILIKMTTPIFRNETATCTVTGKPNTEYTIKVYYSTAASTAAGLDKKTSELNGNVSWSWKIGGNTTQKDHYLIITGGGETLRVDFTVE